ncbi:MAG: tetratricopeptide repeat protein, partial [Elusimicrobiota bacterium]
AFACVLLLAFDSTFWNVCGVQEMYSLTLLFAVLLLGLALRLRAGFSPRTWLCFCLAYGLFLGNRTDLLLWAPGLLWLSLSRGALRRGAWPREDPWRWFSLSCAFGLLGLCVYLYLPLRSMRGPWLDWNHPATLANFIGSLTRRGYGGTLDLLSKSYGAGTMFLPNLEIYARHLWANFGLPGLALAAAGAWSAWRGERSRLAGEGLLFLAAGPVFLYLANMPPNPHALAIVEPHYLLADLVLALWAGMGVGSLPGGFFAAAPSAKGEHPRSRDGGLLAAAAVLVLAVQPWLLGRWARMDRRWNLMDFDYVGNVLRSAPSGAALIAKKDVQLFSLWHFLRVEGRRPDLRVAAQGLSHSPWYQASHAREASPLRLGELQDAEGFRRFLGENEPPVFATTDVEVPAGVPLGPPRGVLLSLSTAAGSFEPPPRRGDAWEFLVLRGDYRYERRPDFFSSDLVDSHAIALQRLGGSLMDSKDDERAEHWRRRAWSMKFQFGDPPAFLGFLFYRSGDLAAAAAQYELARLVYDRIIVLTEEYRSLPEVKAGVRSAAADALINLGVAYEKLGKPLQAEAAYRRVGELEPGNPRGHYNLAVLHWNKDWEKTVSELEAALNASPGYPDALRYLGSARAAREKARGAGRNP